MSDGNKLLLKIKDKLRSYHRYKLDEVKKKEKELIEDQSEAHP